MIHVDDVAFKSGKGPRSQTDYRNNTANCKVRDLLGELKGGQFNYWENENEAKALRFIPDLKEHFNFT